MPMNDGPKRPHPRPPGSDGAQGKPFHGKGKGDKSGNKGGKRGGGLRYGAYGGYKGVPRKKALRFVNSDIRRLARDTNDEARQERRKYRRTRGDINAIASATRDNVAKLNANTTQSYNSAIEQSKAAQEALSAQIASNSGAVQSGANSELARLGLGGSDVTGQMTADAAYAQNTAAQNSQDNLSNIGLASANAQSLGDLMLGSIKGEQMHQKGQARNIRDENVSQLRDALHAARAGRGDSVRALLDQMAQTGWAQYMDQAQLNLQRRALKKTGSSYGYGGGSSYSGSSYPSSSYSSTYGYGYSSPSGTSGGSSSGGTANAAKMALYKNLLKTTP